ncbi:MAG: phosphoribosyl-ATP diphosphatase [Methanomicrobiales archaeon]|nr:phosphoribosyl-ATP diphosphatase [Methanomicrobiales archaeon]
MKQKVDAQVIAELWAVICERADHPTEQSYTSRLLRDPKGIDKALEKVGEEATEFILAVKNGKNERTVEETADLFFHILVALRGAGVELDDVLEELKKRRK